METDRNRRHCEGGRNHPRPSSSRRNCRSHRNGKEHWFKPVHRHRIRFVSNLEDKKLIATFEASVVMEERGTASGHLEVLLIMVRM